MNTEEYFETIEEETEKAFDLAEEAREQARDPEKRVDIPVAKDLAQKASSLVIAAKFPELEDQGVAERIRELEEEFGKNDERVSFEIAREIAEEKFTEFDSLERACDAGIRVGVSYMTGGITTAPLEGIGDIRIRENDDGSEYLAVYYSGPIRSAGGTASAMSVLLADYVRKEVGLSRFKPSEKIISRYSTEVDDYYNRVTAKQYYPEREETEKIAENVPVEVTGGPTRDLEVSNHKDLERVETNQIRGGMCLVYLDGLPLKAPKIKKRIEKWGKDFGLEHWEWIDDYLELKKEIHSSEDSGSEDEEESKYTPSDTYMGSLTAGRPVLGHPGETGGFRLRYASTRTNGLAASSFHPATLEVLEQFPAIGTQLKVEYPMKATVVTPSDAAHPPVVRLKDGTVEKITSREEAKEKKRLIDEVLFVGDILVAWVRDWWWKETVRKSEEKDIKIGKDFSEQDPSFREAEKISEVFEVPIHPKYTYHWSDTTPEKIKALKESLDGSHGIDEGKAKKCLEEILVPHHQEEDFYTIQEPHRTALETILEGDLPKNLDERDPLEIVNEMSPFEIRDKAPHYIGARMGRPEKAEKRTLDGKPQLLFPCGKEEGGRMRNLSQSYQEGSVNEEIIHYRCPECGEIRYYPYCTKCKEETDPLFFCADCGKEYTEEPETCDECGSERFNRYRKTEIDVEDLMDQALDHLGMRHPPELLKSPRAMSGKHRHAEPIEKGLIRQKHGLYVNKDGTVRYDASDLPMTHFKPKEISVSVEKLRKLGYTKDVDGNRLESEEQVLALKPQDIVIPDGSESLPASDYMLEVAEFVDETLENFYGLEPFYEADTKEDLVGELVVGLAPHTSGGTVGRIIGFTDAKGIYAHPYWHAAKRRNSDGDEDAIMLLMDGLLNFSRQFLPDITGARTMDAPLILSTVLNPDEVDDEAWAMETIGEYPLEFYRETQEYKKPWELETDIEIGEDVVESEDPFCHSYTNKTNNEENGPVESEYVTLDDMEEKTFHQLELGEKIKAVREDDVADLLLRKHFLPDIKGNLRSFSSQELRCTACNEKFRRVPLTSQTIAASGKTTAECPECGGDLLLTISEGTIKKYMEPSRKIIENYQVSPYVRQQIMILKDSLQSLFGKEKRQSGLTQFS